ncbi:hypothetical protein [Pseudorhodoplanes sp.]|uniref:hypothetical protein n=1 Tax=Pseudorhodoplanes sp. TaxID=1934341 RepID=UPI00391D1120
MTESTTRGERAESRQEPELDRRYGRIAISALVAALPYGGESRREPAPRKDRQNRGS